MLERTGERFQVARDHGRIEAELDRSEEQVARVEIATEGVTGLVEESAAVLGVGLWPQGGDELVAAKTPLTSDGKKGEQSQSLPLLRRADARGAVDVDCESAERLEVEHVAPFDWPLSGF
jgi:hypothetical protein